MPTTTPRRRISSRLSGHLQPSGSIQHTPGAADHSSDFAVPLNDDQAEKRRRRLDEQRRRRSNLISPGSQSNRSAVIGASGPSTGPTTPARRPLTAVDPKSPAAAGTGVSAIQTLTEDELNQRYEEWMKVVTDGKVNAANSWSFGLIDYFANLRLLSNTSSAPSHGNDSSINFQKASCTLDGCVKIYTTRVDAVATETGRLLNGLMTDAGGAEGRRKAQDELDDDDDEPGEDRGRAKRKSRKQEATVHKDFGPITARDFEHLEFIVDPLFKKTAAEFDEGGAKGLLLNHLSTNGGLKVIFDSSDAIGDIEEDHVELDQAAAEQDDLIDVARLAGLINLDRLGSLDICNQLKTFSFNATNSDDLPLINIITQQDASMGREDDLDDFLHPQAEQNVPGADFMGFFGGDDDDMDDGEFGLDELAASASNARGHMTHEDYVMAMTENPDAMYSYFDSRLTRNWAGPEHWKLHRFGHHRTKPEGGGEAVQTPARKKREKEVFAIDFLSEVESPLDVKKIFTKSATSISMPKSHHLPAEKYILPPDFRLTSKDFFSLFIKPSIMVTSRGRRFVRDAGQSTLDNGDDPMGAPDDWDQGEDDVEFGAPIPESQAFVDTYAGDDDDLEGLAGMMRELDQADAAAADEAEYGDNLFASGRRVRPEFMKYAKVAKRVDVKRLKMNLWKELVGQVNATDEAVEKIGVEVPEEQRFTEAIGNLRQVYPEQKIKDISVSFCFICLLHLANEKTLEITANTGGVASMADLVIRQSANE